MKIRDKWILTIVVLGCSIIVGYYLFSSNAKNVEVYQQTVNTEESSNPEESVASTSNPVVTDEIEPSNEPEETVQPTKDVETEVTVEPSEEPEIEATVEPSNDDNDDDSKTEVTDPEYLYVAVKAIKLRKKPNADGDVILFLDKGTKMEYIEAANPWWSKVKVNGKEGYVCNQYTSETPIENE